MHNIHKIMYQNINIVKILFLFTVTNDISSKDIKDIKR